MKLKDNIYISLEDLSTSELVRLDLFHGEQVTKHEKCMDTIGKILYNRGTSVELELQQREKEREKGNEA